MRNVSKESVIFTAAGMVGLSLVGLSLVRGSRQRRHGTLGGIEAGGTHIVVCVAKGSPSNIVDKYEFPTTTPEETLETALSWLLERNIDALGIASFGPLELDRDDPHFGCITTTPKPFWSDFDLLQTCKSVFPDIPIQIQTDVNAAALAEMKYGGHGHIHTCSYITVGTGVGAGLCVGGKPIVGLSHPEGGHILVPKHVRDTQTQFEGTCPYHGSCIEGMASAASLAARVGCKPSQLRDLNDDHWVWELAGHYLGHLCATIALIISPQLIVLGGGVLKRRCIYEFARTACKDVLNGYVAKQALCDHIERYIVPPTFGTDAGPVGALELARIALFQEHLAE